jgi:hypothetical protein
MPETREVRGDKLVLATISVLRTLVFELHKAGVIEIASLLAKIDDSIAAHREHGDPNQLADAIEVIGIGGRYHQHSRFWTTSQFRNFCYSKRTRRTNDISRSPIPKRP